MSGEDRQLNVSDYALKQVDVRLKLAENRTYYSASPITDADSAVEFMSEILKDLDREWVCVLNLDTKMKPINFNVVSVGSIDRALAPIQNIMKAAVLSNASNLILIHTHPSGDPEPSDKDLLLTKRVVMAGKLMDLPVVDHVILASETGLTYSIRSNFPDLFDGPLDEELVNEMLSAPKKKSRDMER